MSGARPARTAVLRLGAVTVAAAVLAFFVTQLLTARGPVPPETERREAILAAAEQHAKELASLDGRTGPPEIKTLRAQATGEWARQLDADIEGLLAALSATGVVSAVHVDALTIADDESEEPKVLLTASSTVSGSAGSKTHQRVLNLALTMAAVDDGWNVAGVEVIA